MAESGDTTPPSKRGTAKRPVAKKVAAKKPAVRTAAAKATPNKATQSKARASQAAPSKAEAAKPLARKPAATRTRKAPAKTAAKATASKAARAPASKPEEAPASKAENKSTRTQRAPTRTEKPTVTKAKPVASKPNAPKPVATKAAAAKTARTKAAAAARARAKASIEAAKKAPAATKPAVKSQSPQPQSTKAQTKDRPPDTAQASAKPQHKTAKPDSSAENARPIEDYSINDPEAFADNLGKFVEESGRVWAAYLRPREIGQARPAQTDEMGEVVKTLSQVSEYWLSDPKRTLEAQTRLWSGFFNLWSGSLARVSGEEAKPAIEPDPSDKRFRDPEWSRNQFFDTIKQAYLLLSDWADDLVDEASDLDPHTRHKAQFYMKQIASALSPTNFVGTNPELIKETLSSNGENLIRGLKMLAEDIEEGKGDLKVRMTDTSQFQVGGNMATTPGKVVMRNDVCELIQYAPSTETVLKTPLLIVPPWINKFYILDLNPQKSFIKWAVEQGHTVFVISWINPDAHQANKGFEHYMNEGILACAEAVEDITGEKQVNTIGYCVGGTLLSVTLAYCAATGIDRIASATLFTTQVDFTHAGDLKVFVDEEQLKVMEDQMAKTGYLDGKVMSSAFNMLRANDLIWPYIINNYLKGKDPLPFDLLYWNSDSTRMPAANHMFYLRNCYLDNTLSRGKMVLDDVKLDLAEVKVPIYNLATREDHIAPPQSVFLGSQFFGGDVRYVLSGSGHIAGVINHPDKNKYQYWTGGEPKGRYEDWVASASETAGSWWPDWQAWIEGQVDERVALPKMGSKTYPPLDDAPGTYVLIKA